MIAVLAETGERRITSRIRYDHAMRCVKFLGDSVSIPSSSKCDHVGYLRDGSRGFQYIFNCPLRVSFGVYQELALFSRRFDRRQVREFLLASEQNSFSHSGTWFGFNPYRAATSSPPWNQRLRNDPALHLIRPTPITRTTS